MTTTTTTISGGILPKEYQDLRDTVADFARTVVAPVSAKHDAEHSFPYEIVAKMGEMGLFGLPFPEEYGGMGGDYFALSLVLEELGKVDQSVAITLEAAVGLGAMPIYRFGTEEQKQKWLPDLTSGRALAGFGLTEPGAGSDAGSTRTTARLEGDEWIINGSKQFITNSGTDITSLVTVTAVTGTTGTAADAKKEISTIIVPSGTPGFTVEPVYNKVGWNASDTHPLTFADARVPRENLLGAGGAAMPTSCPSWTRAGLRLQRWPPARRRAVLTRASSTPTSVSRLASRSALIRRSASRSRGWRHAPMLPAQRTMMPPQRCWRASPSRRRRRSRR